MKMDLSISVFTKVKACVIAAAFCSAGLAYANDTAEDPIVAAYAKDAGLTKHEAKRFLVLQDMAGELQVELERAMPEIFGGLYIDHTPRFQVVVHLTEGDESLVKPLLTAKTKALKPFLKVRRSERSLGEMQAGIHGVGLLIREVGVAADLNIDVRRNLITVNVSDPVELAAALARAGKSLPSGTAMLRVRELTKPLAAIAGGLSITECTSGFSVIHPDGRRGIATAAHCNNNNQYYQGTLLPWRNGAEGGDWDVQWHSTPGYTPTNLVWNGANYVSITGLKARAGQAIGEFVCKNGRVSGYTCGYIRSTTFAPSSIPNATSTWVTLGSATTYGEGGDSGAPFWKGNMAYGFLHGIYYDYDYGEYRLVYMGADRMFYGIGVYILVTP